MLSLGEVGGEEKEQGEKEPPSDGGRCGSPHERHTGTGGCLCSCMLLSSSRYLRVKVLSNFCFFLPGQHMTMQCNQGYFQKIHFKALKPFL